MLGTVKLLPAYQELQHDIWEDSSIRLTGTAENSNPAGFEFCYLANGP